MKRLFSRLLPAIFGLMLISAMPVFAQQDAEAKSAYEQLLAKSQEMSDGNMFCHLNMDMREGDMSLNAAMDMNMLYKNMLQPDQMQFMCQYIIYIEGQPIPMTVWYYDGYMYSDFMGQKTKMRTNMAEAVQTVMTSANALNVSTDFFSDLSLSTSGDQRILNYKMDGSKMNAYLNQVFSQMGLTSLLNGIQINVHDISGNYALNPDNTYSTAQVSMGIDMSAEGETVTIDVDGQIEVLNPGQPVEIFYPNLAEFVEVSPANAA